MAGEITVKGVRELERAFDDVNRDLPKSLARRYATATEQIASVARSKVPRRSGRARSGIRAQGDTIVASGVPYLPWLDFGGRTGRGGRIERRFIPGGRFIYPAITEQERLLEDMTDAGVEDAAEDHGFVTRG